MFYRIGARRKSRNRAAECKDLFAVVFQKQRLEQHKNKPKIHHCVWLAYVIKISTYFSIDGGTLVCPGFWKKLTSICTKYKRTMLG